MDATPGPMERAGCPGLTRRKGWTMRAILATLLLAATLCGDALAETPYQYELAARRARSRQIAMQRASERRARVRVRKDAASPPVVVYYPVYIPRWGGGLFPGVGYWWF